MALLETKHYANNFHAGRREVRERIRRDVGADDRLPRDGSAQRVMDRRAEHRRSRRLVGGHL